jgi:CSLREA domain-containing protein
VNGYIVGAGPGVSIIDNSGLTGAMTRRAFDLTGSSSSLTLRGVTIAHGTAATENGLAVRVNPGASMKLIDSALVNHVSLGGGSAIYVDRGALEIRRSVITNNRNQISGGAAVYVQALSGGAASVVIGETIFALNSQYQITPFGADYTTRNVQVVGNVAKTNKGGNLYDDASGGFFNTTPGTGDYFGSVNYVVTSVADTFNHADDNEALSLREAVDLANQASGPRTIWLPAWRFVLTRDRGTNATDTSVAYGDLDVKNIMTIRGVAGRTSVGAAFRRRRRRWQRGCR